MSVTQSTYTAGGNTFILQVASEITSTNIIDGVSTVLSGQGWTLYDTVTAGVLGNPFTPIVTKVYQALNADGVSYKYLIIRWDTIKLMFYTSCCESWNTSTHLPLNESWTQAGGFAQGYDPQSCSFIISATARHFMIWPFINHQPGLWTAVMEFERVAAEDIAAAATTPYPCYAWTSSVMIGTPWGQGVTAANSTGPSTVMFAFPRLPDGTVGQSAANYMSPMTDRGMWPPSFPQATINVSGDVNFGHLGSYYKNLNYKWDPTGTRVPASSFSVDSRTKYMPYGRAFNFGVTTNVGYIADTLFANVDLAGGWPSGNIYSSTSTECLLLPMNGGTEANAQYTYQPGTTHYGVGNTSMYTTTVITVAAAGGVATGKVLSIGDNLWVATTDGIRVASASSPGFTTSRLYNSSGIYDIVFDGQRTIYGGAANGIVKIDTINGNVQYATTANTIANGCAYLGIDAKNVYATSRTGNTAPTCVVLDQASFTIGSSNVFLHTGTLFSTATVYGVPVPDYQGNVFVVGQASTTVSTNGFVAVFTANTGAKNIQAHPRGTNTCYGGDSFWYDYITNRLWLVYAQPSLNVHIQQELYPANVLTAGSSITCTAGGITFSGNPGSTNFSPGSSDYRGDLSIIPFRGMFFIGLKRSGLQSQNVAVPGYFTTFLHPTQTTGTYPSGQFVTNNNVNITQGLINSPFQSSSGLTTNGCQLFSTTNSGGYYYIQVINGIYQTTRSDTLPTGRLLLRG